MSTSAVEIEISLGVNVTVTQDTLSVDLSDGRTISAPYAYPSKAISYDHSRN